MKKVLLVSALFSTIAVAQPTEGKIRQLEEQMKTLQQEIQKLKEEQKKTEEVKQETDVLKEELRKLRLEITMPQLEIKSYHGLGPAASKALFNPKGVSVGGYGEIHFTHNPDRKPKNIMDTRRVVFYFGYSFNEKLKFNSEIEWTHALVKGGEKSGAVAVEFAIIDYSFNEKLGLRGGLVFIPVGIINEYHEPTTFPSVDRPFLERNIIPTTWRELGFGAYGSLGKLDYRVYITNGFKANKGVGRRVEAGQLLQGFKQNGFISASDQIAFSGRFDYNLPHNLMVGASGFFSGVQDEKGKKLGSLNLLSPHLWWQHGGWDVRLVGAYGTTSGANKISQEISTNPECRPGNLAQCTTFPKRFHGFYTQLAYDVFRLLKVSDQELYVFGIYENYNTHASVPEGFRKPSGHKVQVFNVGISYKPHPLVALKADYVRFSPKGAKKQNIYGLALGWMF